MPDPATPPSTETTTGLRPDPDQHTGSGHDRNLRHGGGSMLHSLMVNLVLPLILLTGAALVFFLLGSVEPEKRAPIDTTRVGRMKSLAPVRIEKLQSLEATGRRLALEVDGTVVPFQEAQVAAEVAGRITMKSKFCEAGQYVQQGDLLMKIDRTDYEIEVERLTRQKEQEYQSLREIDQEMANAQRLIKVASDDVKLQHKEVDRQRSLPKGYASRADIEKAERALLAATQSLVTAENQLDLLRQRRIRLEASERLAATSLRAAEINLKRTEIRAPIEGVIVSEEADVNTFVSRGQTLVVIDNTSKAEVASSLRMDQLYWVLDQSADPSKANASRMARSYDLPETPAIIQYVLSGRENVVYRWKGRLLSYNGIGLDNDTRTVPVRIIVDDPQTMVDEDGQPIDDRNRSKSTAAALVRGMYVQVKLLISPTTPLVVIPARAIRPGNRVFQFIPDETVLQPKRKLPPVESAANQTEQDDEPDQVTVVNDEQVDPFDPDQWVAGRVVSRNSITPINSMAVVNQNGKSISSSGDKTEKLWVCEVTDQVVGPDSWVVVSPIGSVDGEFLPARAAVTKAEKQEIEPTESSASTRRQIVPKSLAAGSVSNPTLIPRMVPSAAATRQVSP